jgi:tetratricopeptide (TPR) repeat protein
MPLLAVLLVASLWLGARILLRSARRAMWRGDYDRALLWVTPLGPFAGDLRARILALAGRFEPAARIFRKRAAQARTPGVRSRELSLLADTLLDQELYAEAKGCLDEAMQLDIGYGGPCNEMASWYLRQGIEPQRALELVERAIATQERAFPQYTRALLPIRLVNKAWALSLLGRPHEAEATISQALQSARFKTAASWAFVYWTAGKAFAAMGEPAKAREHFERACKIDPHGNYGKRARMALASNGAES